MLLCILQASTSMSHGNPDEWQGRHALPPCLSAVGLFPLPLALLASTTPWTTQISSYVLPGAGSQLLSDLAVPGLGVPDVYSHTDTHTRMQQKSPILWLGTSLFFT